ncbi:MAG: hypothetical protein ACYS9H_08215, partial [Planctomycetota bacterium]
EKILSLPAYRHLGEMPGFRGYPGGTCLCPTDPGSIKLISMSAVMRHGNWAGDAVNEKPPVSVPVVFTLIFF